VVFGREAAHQCARSVKPGTPHRAFKADSTDAALARLDKFRHAKGSRRTADIRLDMQRVMQSDAAVFRTGETLNEGKRKLAAVFESFSDVQVTDRSMVWNTDLMINRKFQITEKIDTDFRAEFYNLPNTSHFNAPDSYVNDSTFGQISSSFGERQIRFGLRLGF